jgi:hypothetical protein
MKGWVLSTEFGAAGGGLLTSEGLMADVRCCESGARGLCPGLIDVLSGEAWRVKRRRRWQGSLTLGRLTRRAESGSGVAAGRSGWSGGREPVR